MNDIRHTTALVYVAATLKDDSPKKISVANLKSPSISCVKSDLDTTFHFARIFFAHEYKQSFTEWQVMAIKRWKKWIQGQMEALSNPRC